LGPANEGRLQRRPARTGSDRESRYGRGHGLGTGAGKPAKGCFGRE
jgi:hypothetical protein